MTQRYYVTLAVVGALLRCCRSFDLTILHTNDVHARFEQFNQYGSSCSEEDALGGECFGGVPRRVTKIEEIREMYENTILIDGGDQFQGTQWFYYYKGNATAYFMNYIGYDAMAIGNHEFDNGVEGVLDFLRNTSFPVLSCNINASGEPKLEPLFQKSTILEVGGERIGIIGYTFSGTPEISKPGKNLVFLDEATSIQEEVDRLTADGIDKIIALGHSGYTKDIEIARNTVGIDVIVGGHSDTFLYTGTPPTDDKVIGPYPTIVTPDGDPDGQVLIVQDFTYAKYLGFLQVTFDDNGRITSHTGNPMVLNASVEQDPEALAEINKWAVPINELSSTLVGETYVLLEGDKLTCRMEECTMGNLVTDAMLENLVTFQSDQSWSDVAIAITNGGGIRTTLDPGLITIGDVTSVLPFSSTFDLFDLKGQYLLEALENSVQHYGNPSLSGRFLQMAGMIVTYNLEWPPGERVVSAEVLCTECSVPDYEPLDVDKMYKVVAPAFLTAGGDGYTMIADNLENLLTGDLDAGVVSDHIAKYSPILQRRERRILFDNTPPGVTPPGATPPGATPPGVTSPSVTPTNDGNKASTLFGGLVLTISIALLKIIII